MFLKAYERGNPQFWLDRTRPKKKKEIEELNKKIDRLQKTVDKLSESLYKHIKFIDSTYENLRNPIDAAKKWLGK